LAVSGHSVFGNFESGAASQVIRELSILRLFVISWFVSVLCPNQSHEKLRLKQRYYCGTTRLKRRGIRGIYSIGLLKI